MRLTKFRGKALTNGDWVFGVPIPIPKGILMVSALFPVDGIEYNCDEELIDPRTVGELTGWVDVNLEKIYEGDVIQTEHGIGYIVWYDGAFWLKSPGSDAMDRETEDFYAQAKVIGNIHDNPELINY